MFEPMRLLHVGLAAGLALLPASRAAACGGFFCSSSPINQAREGVAYAYEEDGTMTMSVQIAYEGRDEDFAWILPLPVEPDEIAVGSDALFAALDQATRPFFQMQGETVGECAAVACDYPSYGGGCSFGCGAFADAAPSAAMDAGFAMSADAGSAMVLQEGVVGPYDTVVLEAETATDVIAWLGDNGYDIPESSEPLLAPYAEQGFVFIALRLNANRDSSVIRPITLSLPTDEACLPIRLTAIATTPSLPIALYFLGDRQATSTNYAYADIELGPDHFMGRVTWDAAVVGRVRELGGQAFATDFAGETPSLSIALPEVDDLAEETDISRFMSQLISRGYSATPLLQELLTRFVDPPGGQDVRTYINCVTRSTARSCGEPDRFDPVGLARAVDAEIGEPRRAGEAMVDRHAYLTRLSTSLRAEDMTVDPVFALDDGLPDVPQTRVATLRTLCSEDYFQENAPQELVVGAVTYPIRGGRTTSGERYCMDRGGTLRSDGSGGCAASRGRRAPLFLVAAFGMLIGVRILRRLRR